MLVVSGRVEIKQFCSLESKWEYFTELWNWIDLSGLILTLMIIVLTLFEQSFMSTETLRITASFASFSLAFKFYDWLRLFEGTSFFIQLIEQTFKDVRWFLILFFVALIAFGIPMSMLDLNRDEESALISASYGFWIIDAIVN